MPITPPKMQSWQVFHYARKHLGSSVLYGIFGKKNARAVDYWCQDPKYTDKSDTAYDPIQGVKRLLAGLDDLGHTDQVRACLAYLAQDTSLCTGQAPEIAELLPTIDQEVLADYKAVSAMQSAIDRGDHPAVIAALNDAAVAEIERTYAKYREEYRG